MAVGQSRTKSKAEGNVCASARALSLEAPLPSLNAKHFISYPNKTPETDIVKPIASEFYQIIKKKLIKSQSITSNAFIWADNYLALHALLSSGTKATLVYLDPPYATGFDFHSRTDEHAYGDSLGSAAYLEFMRRRLILIREILSDSGSVYVHIGHQMVSELKLIMDEVFGAKNFKNIITRKKCSSKNFTKNQYPNLNDYILFYSKSNNYVWNRPTQTAEKDWIDREYPKQDEKGRYKLVPIHAPGTRNGETGTEWRGMMPPPGKHWQFKPSKLDELQERGEIYWSKTGNPRRKVYLTDDKQLPISDYWDQYRDAHHQSVLITGYPTEKNFEMMKMLVATSSNEGDLVIDPFCGSGSTIHAASVLKRTWIGIDQSSLAAKTVIKRLSQGRKPMGDYVQRDSNLQLFLDPQNSQIPLEKTSGIFNFYISKHMSDAQQQELNEIMNSSNSA